MKLHLLTNLDRQIVQVSFIALREDDLRQAGSLRRHHLLLEAADREYAPLQRYLTGHADRALYRLAREQRGKRGDDGDSGTGPIFRDSARGYVQVELTFVEGALLDAQLRRMALDVGQGNTG